MRACNNNNMRNPSLHLFYYGVTHVIIVACPHPLSCCIYTALISCLAAYILPSSSVLLHIYCPHPLSCCIYTALILCLAAYILPSSSVLLHIYCPHPLSCCIHVYTALFPCFAAYILPSSPVLLHTCIYCHHPLCCCIYTALVSLLFGTVIPTSFNIFNPRCMCRRVTVLGLCVWCVCLHVYVCLANCAIAPNKKNQKGTPYESAPYGKDLKKAF